MYCEGCGVRLDSGDRFCGACGTVAPRGAGVPATCACGVTLEHGARFCVHCGLPVVAPARPVAGGVSDARLSAPAKLGLPLAGARVLGPSRRGKRQPQPQPQPRDVAEADPAWLGEESDSSLVAEVPIAPYGQRARAAEPRPWPVEPASKSGQAGKGSAGPASAPASEPPVPTISTRGGTRVQMAGAGPSAGGPSPILLAAIFVGSFLLVTGTLVAAYSRALPRQNGGQARVANGLPGQPPRVVLPAAGEMLRDVRVLPIAGESRTPGLAASLSFDARGNLVAVCSRDGALRVWDLVAEREVRLARGVLSSDALFSAALFGPGEPPLLAAAEVGPPSQVSVLEPGGKRLGLRIPTSAPAVAIAILPGDRLRIVTRGGALKTWNLRSGRADNGEPLLPWKEVEGFPEVVTFSRDGAWVARASGPGVDVWNLERRGPPARVDLPGRPSGLAFRGDGQHIAVAVSGEIGIWDFVSGRKLRSFDGHRFSVSAVAFSPDGRLLGSVAESEVGIWDVLDGYMRDRVNLPGETFRSVGFNPAGTWLGVGSENQVRLYRAR